MVDLSNNEAIQQRISLPKVFLSRRGIVDFEVAQIASYEVTHIRLLGLSANRITSEGISYLTQGKWTSLQRLYLHSWNEGENQISDMGCRWLTRVGLLQLLDLYLGKNQISEVGIKHFYKARLPQLSYVDLEGNPLGYGIVHLTKLQCLELVNALLCGCEFEYDRAMKVMLAEWPQIKEIIISQNSVSQIDKQALNEKLVAKGVNLQMV